MVHGQHGGGYFGAEGAHGDLGRPVLPTGESDLAAVCMGGWRKSVQASRYNLAEQSFLCVNSNSIFLQMGRLLKYQFQIMLIHLSVCLLLLDFHRA